MAAPPAHTGALHGDVAVARHAARQAQHGQLTGTPHAMQLGRAAVALAAGICLLVADAAAQRTTVWTSGQLREALRSSGVDVVILKRSITLNPDDWSSQRPARVLCRAGNMLKTVTGTAPAWFWNKVKPAPKLGPFFALDFNGLVDVMRIGPNCTLHMQSLELLSYMQQDGTPAAYFGGLPAIDAARSGPGATLSWSNVVSFVRVGLPVKTVYSFMNGTTGGLTEYADKNSSQYCYLTTRDWKKQTCVPGVRIARCVCASGARTDYA